MENNESIGQNITPFLWFNDNAEEAMNLYTSVFENSKIKSFQRLPDGKVMTCSFDLAGQPFAAINGGPRFQLNPAMSFFVVCETAEEVDAIWHKITEGGKVLMALDTYPWSGRYGWGQDRFGLTWQVMLGDLAQHGQKIVPCLMFAGDLLTRADEAVNFYTNTFRNTEIKSISRYTAEEPAPEGSVKHALFTLNNNTFSIMGSAMPHAFAFNEAVSFIINCETQQDIDYYWHTLISDGGAESMCGWLKDKFGVSWQVIPPILFKLMSDKDPAKSGRAMQAMFKMKKIIIQDLEDAHKG